MASDKKTTDQIRKRPSSAPKPPQMSTIPKIVLEGGGETATTNQVAATAPLNSSCPPVSSSPPVTATPPGRSCSPHEGYSGSTLPRSGLSGASSGARLCRNQIPVRSSSDIGLPATSMPNLAMQMGLAGAVADSENYLGVYCSPRTSRRSVDLDINSKEETRGQYEWIETLDSSSNSLQVLTAASRVGSALSLNSECTTRSIGLLSNDSDSDDLSLSEKDRPIEKPAAAQLRRYLSYPEESTNQDTSARPSQSLCNLKQVNTSSAERALRTGKSLDCSLLDRRHEPKYSYSSNHSSGTPSSQPSDQEEPQSPPIVSGSVGKEDGGVGDNEVDHVKTRLHTVGIRKTSGYKKSENILCYKCDANASTRDGRIRQWLQDMDRHDYTD